VADVLVGDGGGDMGLAAPGRAADDEPAVRRGGEFPGGAGGLGELLATARMAAPALGIEVVEGQPGQRPEVAVGKQPQAVLRAGLSPDAGAGHDTAVVRFAGGQARVDETGPATYLTIGLATTGRLSA